MRARELADSARDFVLPMREQVWRVLNAWQFDLDKYLLNEWQI